MNPAIFSLTNTYHGCPLFPILCPLSTGLVFRRHSKSHERWQLVERPYFNMENIEQEIETARAAEPAS